MSVLFPLLEESWNGQPEWSVDQKIPPDPHCSMNGSMRWSARLVQICSRLLALNAKTMSEPIFVWVAKACSIGSECNEEWDFN